MATEFRITEQPPTGSEGDGGAQASEFVWTTAKSAPGNNGGARACPVEVLEIGGKQTLVRTKNPGAIFPSFQILGPDREPISLHGRWDDRYNFRGYAVQEMRRFEDLCRRGNMVRVEVDREGFIGLLSDWKFSYRRHWDISYSFTLSVHSRDDEAVITGTPVQTNDPGTILANANRQGDAVAATHARRPEASTYGKVMKAINQALGSVSVGILSVANILDTRTGVLKPIGDFKAIATQLRSIQGNCSTVLNQLVTAKAETQMTVRTAKDVLDFEAWTKSVGSQLRLLRQHCAQGALACDRRDVGSTTRIYRPRKSQSLYSVSQDCYGTPFAWKLIYNANHLHSVVALGNETWVIPAKGAVAA